MVCNGVPMGTQGEKIWSRQALLNKRWKLPSIMVRNVARVAAALVSKELFAK